MTQSVQNFDNHNNRYGLPPQAARSQMHPQPQAIRIPEFYEPDEKHGFLDMVKESPIYTMGIRGFFGPLIDHPFASLLTWFGCGWALDKYISAGGGEYDKSLFKKLTNFGDKLENSKFVQSKPVQTVLGWFKGSGKKAGNVIQNSSVLRSVWNNPTMPELEMVKSEMFPQRLRILHDFNYVTKELKLADEGYVGLNKLALDKNDKKSIKEFFNAAKISEIPEAKASSYIQLKRLGKSDAEIKRFISAADGGVSAVKSEILKAFGNKDIEWIKKVQKDTVGDFVNDVQAATKKVGGKVKISMGNFRLFGLDLGFLTAPTKRTISCDNIHNRLFSLEKGAKTATGRFMSRFVQMVHRGLTFGGGKLGVLLFIAPAFVETAINVHKAEPNEKIGTGVNNLVGHISWVFTFPLALQIMHHIFGARYAGMTTPQIQEIRNRQTAINDKNKLKGTDKGYGSYKDWEKDQKKFNEYVKNVRKANFKKQKWYNNIFARFASLFTPDLGKLDAYRTGNWFTTKISQMRNLPRNMFGVPARLIIFGLLTMGVLDTAINKTLKFFFGGSYDSMKEEELKDAKKEQKKFLKEDLTDRLYEAQRNKIVSAGLAQTAKSQNTVLPQQQPSGIAHKGAGTARPIPVAYHSRRSYDNYTYIPSQQNIIKSPAGKGKQDNYTYIPSQDSVIKSNDGNGTNVRTYVPSQAAANIQKNWDNSGLQSALDRADRAERRAEKILSGNFEGMP